MGFSRRINTVTQDSIRARYQEVEDWPIALAEITHDGLSDGHEGKDTSPLYFTGAEWIRLPTAE